MKSNFNMCACVCWLLCLLFQIHTAYPQAVSSSSQDQQPGGGESEQTPPSCTPSKEPSKGLTGRTKMDSIPHRTVVTGTSLLIQSTTFRQQVEIMLPASHFSLIQKSIKSLELCPDTAPKKEVHEFQTSKI